MEFTDREINLILSALYVLETFCIEDSLDFDIESDLGGTPDPSEVRNLMNKIIY